MREVIAEADGLAILGLSPRDAGMREMIAEADGLAIVGLSLRDVVEMPVERCFIH
jgi:hypothetical protein